MYKPFSTITDLEYADYVVVFTDNYREMSGNMSTSTAKIQDYQWNLNMKELSDKLYIADKLPIFITCLYPYHRLNSHILNAEEGS